MQCPKCLSNAKVTNSRDLHPLARFRRRSCERCGHRFTTYEIRNGPEAAAYLHRVGALSGHLGGTRLRELVETLSGTLDERRRRLDNERQLLDDTEQLIEVLQSALEEREPDNE